MPKISFVIPTRNRSKLVVEALQSIQQQTETDWEAVVVDDHGSDDTQEAIAKLSDARIKYYRLPDNCGNGVASARNYGNQLAQAELIAVLDSDDVCLPERAQLAVDSYDTHGWDFYSTNRITEDMSTGERKSPSLPDEWDAEAFKTYSYVTHSSVVYTKKAALEIPYNSALPVLDDYDLISRFMEAGKKMHLDPKAVTVIWRRHPATVTNDSVSIQKVYLQAIRHWRGWVKENVDLSKLAK